MKMLNVMKENNATKQKNNNFHKVFEQNFNISNYVRKPDMKILISINKMCLRKAHVENALLYLFYTNTKTIINHLDISKYINCWNMKLLINPLRFATSQLPTLRTTWTMSIPCGAQYVSLQI
jgi:hypothetical protein